MRIQPIDRYKKAQLMLGLSDEWCRLPESNWRPTDYKSVARSR
ncbi:hypothetical protein [Pseudocolwellia agarivorans]|nr:hypothetical protein [Pseudocolwellia agarivorans]